MAKIGAGHAAAMGRLGLRELRAAVHPQSNVAQSSEYGVYGTMTPGEVAESRRDDGRSMEEEIQTGGEVERRLEAARSRDDRTQDRSQEKASIEMER